MSGKTFPVTICVKLKCDRICVVVPVDKTTKTSELKKAFIEASTVCEEYADSDLSPSDIKLFKSSSDDEGNPSWKPMDDTETVDKVGLDQGHVVGVSLKKNGAFKDPHVEIPEEVADDGMREDLPED